MAHAGAFAYLALGLRPVLSPALARVHVCPRRGARTLTAMAERPSGGKRRRFDPKNPPPPPPKFKLEPEEVFFEGPPSWTELIVPTLSILTVVGLIPFAAAVARYAWVRYKITSRRIAVDSGFRGQDHIEIVYRDIASVKYIRRFGGSTADCVLNLNDGAKLELRAVPNFDNVYQYMLSKLEDEAKEASGSA
jgi:hypothetical protein